MLGIWIQTHEGAKFWAGVCAELANRGVRDVLIVRCDGLTGLAEAIEATWPQATVQTCVVHLIRAATRFVPLLSFPPMLHQVIYTTNSIESLNHQQRKVTQEPGPLPLQQLALAYPERINPHL